MEGEPSKHRRGLFIGLDYENVFIVMTGQPVRDCAIEVENVLVSTFSDSRPGRHHFTLAYSIPLFTWVYNIHF